MRLRADTRGQAIQIGAVLLFAALITAYASYQAFVVPDQNRQVEFNHNKEVRGDLLDLRNAIVSPSGGGESVSVALGTQYPSRALLLNPPAPSGSLRTLGTGNASRNLTIQNATATGEVGDFWNGTAHTYPTGGFVYQPNYNEYDDVPTYYENTVLFSQARSAAVPLSGQRLVDGDEVNLVTFNGSLSVTRTTTTAVDVEAISVSEQTITVSNETANVTIAFPTRLSTERWRTLLDGESNVVDIRNRSLGGGVDLLLVDLKSGVNYELQMSKVGFGQGLRPAARGYIVPAEDQETKIPERTTRNLTVEVRDEYNNPKMGVSVNATTKRSDTSVTIVGSGTDADGRIRLTYSAPENIDQAIVHDRVNVSYAVDPATRPTFDPSTPANLSLPVTVEDVDTPPSVNVTDVVYTGGSQVDAYDVTTSLTDPDGDLENVTFRMEGPSGNLVDTTTVTTITGESAVVTETVTASKDEIAPFYSISVVARDARGTSGSDLIVVPGDLGKNL